MPLDFWSLSPFSQVSRQSLDSWDFPIASFCLPLTESLSTLYPVIRGPFWKGWEHMVLLSKILHWYPQDKIQLSSHTGFSLHTRQLFPSYTLSPFTRGISILFAWMPSSPCQWRDKNHLPRFTWNHCILPYLGLLVCKSISLCSSVL